MNTITKRLLAAALLVSVVAGSAGAAVTYKDRVPDFYQHQKSFQTKWDWKASPRPAYPGPPDAIPSPLKASYNAGNWWESTGGWCQTTAIVDALAYVDKELNAPGLYDHSRGHLSGLPEHAAAHTWQERYAYANEDLAIIAGGTDGACADAADIRTYANKWGVGLKVTEFTWDGGKVKTRSATGAAFTDASGTYSSMFDVAKQRWDDGIMVGIIRGSADAWWSGSFHAFPLAGIDVGAKLLAFSDPNDTFRGADWGFSYKNTDAYPTDNAYKATLTLADGRTVGNHRATYNGVEGAVDQYNGAVLMDIFLLSVPGPGPTGLALVGTLLAVRRRRA